MHKVLKKDMLMRRLRLMTPLVIEEKGGEELCKQIAMVLNRDVSIRNHQVSSSLGLCDVIRNRTKHYGVTQVSVRKLYTQSIRELYGDYVINGMALREIIDAVNEEIDNGVRLRILDRCNMFINGLFITLPRISAEFKDLQTKVVEQSRAMMVKLAADIHKNGGNVIYINTDEIYYTGTINPFEIECDLDIQKWQFMAIMQGNCYMLSDDSRSVAKGVREMRDALDYRNSSKKLIETIKGV